MVDVREGGGPNAPSPVNYATGESTITIGDERIHFSSVDKVN